SSAKGSSMTNRSFLSSALVLCMAGTTACSHLGAPERQAFDPARCRSGSFDVYFKPDDARLSTQAKAQIEAVKRAMSSCKIAQISVVGLADGTSDAQKAKTISQARANAIAASLDGAGVPHDKLRTLASGTIPARGADTDALMQRRAQVTIRVAGS